MAQKILRHAIVALGAILGLAFISNMLLSSLSFFTTTFGSIANLSLGGIVGAGVGAWVGAMVADKLKQ